RYLGNMYCIRLAPYRNRWYFHHESSSEFSSSFTDTLGFADATFDCNDQALAPQIAMQPADRVAIASRPFSLSVAASGGHPFGYQWQWSVADVTTATNATL